MAAIGLGYLLSLDIGAISDDVSNCGESDRLKTRATRAAEYETRDDRAAAKKRNITNIMSFRTQILRQIWNFMRIYIVVERWRI